MRRLLPLLALLVLVVLAWLTFAPVPIQPVAWQSPASGGYSGAHARNERLKGLQLIALASDRGPEHIVAHDGWLYSGLAGGLVLRVPVDAANGTSPQPLFNTGGRPLGLAFDPQGRLLIADGLRGLLRVSLPAAKLGAAADAGPVAVETLLDHVDDGTARADPVRYADGVVVEPDGRIWLTDASRRFGAKAWGGTFEASLLDTLEHSCSGRLLTISPAGHAEVALRDLCFPNGLALTQDGHHLLLSETGTYRILKLRTDVRERSATELLAAAAQAASASADLPLRVLIDNLPGYPDNLTRGEHGRIWTGLTKPRSAVLDLASSHPWLRSLTMRLPRALWPVPPAYGHLIAFDDNGSLLADLQDPSGAYPDTTSATEASGRLYVQSLNASAIGWLDLHAAGL